LRETLFNVLSPRVEGSHFLDLYAGSGAVGIEALSRGAARVVFVERAAAALKALHANLASLGLPRDLDIHSETAKAYLSHDISTPGFDIVFLDPPYDASNEYEITLSLLGGKARGLLRNGAIVIAEHRRQDKLPGTIGALRRTRLLQQGDAALSFYAVPEAQAEQQEENA
jgi:16S rRNA (guanine(966)-N(2))-methyltransferase RsmD